MKVKRMSGQPRVSRKGLMMAACVLVLCASSVMAENITITVSTNVLRTGVIGSGLNFGAGHNKLTVGENFEGTLYRQAHSGILYSNGFVPFYINTSTVVSTGWDDVYTGGGFRISSDPARGVTGLLTGVSNLWVDLWGTGELATSELNSNFRSRAMLLFDQVIPGIPTNGIRDLTLQFERISDDEGFLPPADWWRSGNCAIAATNAPGVPGRSALRMDGSVSDAFIRLDSFGTSELDINTDWQCSFWVKTLSGTPNVSFDYRANIGAQVTNFSPSTTWEKKVIDFSVSGLTNNSVVAEIFVDSGEVLIDHVEYRLMGHTNSTAYTDDFMDVMKAFNPGMLRATLDMGGYSITNRILPRMNWMHSEFRLDRRVGPALPVTPLGVGRASYQELLEVYEEIGAEPWLSISGTLYTNEIVAFIEWLAGPTNTTWGKVRADLGHPVPWTDVFDQITIEYGNESWNSAGAFQGAGSYSSNYWYDLTAAAKASPYYTSNISITIGGQAASSASQDTLMYVKNTNADAFCSAPYVMDSYYTNDLAMLTNVTHEFEYFMAYPLWKTYEDFAVRHANVLSDTNTFEYKYYEYNYHTTHGDAANTTVAERIATFNGSRAHGISLINFSLLSLKDLGVNRQCLFKAQEGDGQPNQKLWSVIRRFKKGSVQARPVWWAFQAVNHVRHGDLVETTHSAYPSFTALGNYSTRRPDGVTYTYTVRTNDSVYSYAFRDGNTNGLVLINYDLDTTQQVTLALSEYVLNDEAVCWELISDSYTNHNDDAAFPDAVSLLETTVSNFTAGVPLELPPCNLKVYQWVSDGILPSIQLSTQNVSVVEGGTGSFDVSLSGHPLAETTVTVSRLSGDTDITVQAGATRVFTTGNWATPQTVTLAAAQDADWVDGEALIQCSAAGMNSEILKATEADDETDPTFLLPWSESFENNATNAGTLGALDGQHGWIVAAGAGAVVTNSDAQSGSQALRVSRATASHTFLGNSSNVWTTLWAKPVTGPKAAQIPSEASAVFYVNTNNLLVAYDSTNATEIAGGVVSNGWNKFAVSCDYVSKIWNLELNDELVVSNFTFYGTPASFSAFEMVSELPDAAWLDELNITGTQNVFDTDGDGLPDAWEIAYYGGPTNADPNAMASNGVNTVRQTYIAGFDPNDPNAHFEISILQSNIFQWNGVSGRVYSIYWTSNLLSNFQALETNVPWTDSVFTDSTHSAEGQGFYKIDVRVE